MKRFFNRGSDILRSKSFDRDSYNSGDWFNTLDFTYQSNNWRVGLPPAWVNSEEWPIMRPILGREDITPAPEDIAFAAAHFQESLQIRASSPLFRLQTADEVMARLDFLNDGADQVPGLIMLRLSDREGENLDENYVMIVVLFNTAPDAVDFSVDALAGLGFELHPVQAASVDPVVQAAAFDAPTGTFSVPGRTAAVFVLPE